MGQNNSHIFKYNPSVKKQKPWPGWDKTALLFFSFQHIQRLLFCFIYRTTHIFQKKSPIIFFYLRTALSDQGSGHKGPGTRGIEFLANLNINSRVWFPPSKQCSSPDWGNTTMSSLLQDPPSRAGCRHYLPLVHKTERSSPIPLHLQNDSSSFIIFFYFIIFLWCTKRKSHISFKNLRKFLVYPLILCFIPNPWKNCYSIFFKLSHIISSSTKETISSLKSDRTKRF